MLKALGTRATFLLAAIGCLLAAWWKNRFAKFESIFPHVTLGNASFTLLGRTDVFVDYLLWGGLVAIALSLPAFSKRLAALFQPGWLGLMTVALFLGRYFVPHTVLLEPVLIAAMILATVVRPDTALGRQLDSRPLRWIGRLSYSLYLWQQLFLWIDPAHPMLWSGSLQLQRFPVNLVGAFTCAWISYQWVEKPAIRMGRRLIEGDTLPVSASLTFEAPSGPGARASRSLGG
jgi:peptidoglycan/LPS O-acetylase OafA/YrhL